MNREERRASRARGATTSGTLSNQFAMDQFAMGVAQHRAGAFAEAERSYRTVLSIDPNHADSLHNLGLIALQAENATRSVELIGKAIAVNDRVAEYHYNIALAYRSLAEMQKVEAHLERAIALRPDHALAHLNLGNVRREQGLIAEADACYQRAIALAPNLTQAHFNLANVLLEQGRLEEAIRAYQRALAAEPQHAEAHAGLGAALILQGQPRDAARHYEQALAARPDLPGVHDKLCAAYLATGDFAGAVLTAQRALSLNETAETRLQFTNCVKHVRFTSKNEALRGLLLRALREDWGRPRDLTNVCITIIKLDSAVKDLISRVNSAWPERLSRDEILGESGAVVLARDPLLRELLKSGPLPDLDLERVFTNLRYGMLASAGAGEPDEKLLTFYCAVARQCFNNQYIFPTTATEAEQARELGKALETALTHGQPFPAIWPVIASAYFPLHRLANSTALLDRSLPEAARELTVLQVSDYAEERRLAATMPVLTTIGDGVSSAVREQYEENPYPRWLRPGPLGETAVSTYSGPPLTGDVLIAGCGTGLSAIDLAPCVPGVQILAVDLSLASLSYAKRMAQKFGISNVEFAQADITQIGGLGRSFNFIDVSGVLHHLADPWHGWRLLLGLLRPGGLMQVGLYSALARQHIVAARALIADRGYRSTPDDIRRFRQDLISRDDPMAQSLSKLSDFYSMDECRDLLFHVQEHRVSLPEIKAFLAANNLQFAGFLLGNPATLQRFTTRFPDPSAPLDLDCWLSFETEEPNTFVGMYQFRVCKLAA
jgi:tetratricopeptide (TPR) repeat protein/SAM-dependent methyltransferase